MRSDELRKPCDRLIRLIARVKELAAMLDWAAARGHRQLVCQLFAIFNTLDPADVGDVIAEVVNHNEQLLFDLVRILELEHLLGELELNRALRQVLPILALLNVLELIQVPAEVFVELWVHFRLIDRLSQVTVGKLLGRLFFELASLCIFAEQADLDDFHLLCQK